jgi:hypothetical protein
MTKSIEITGINESIAYCEAKGLSKIFEAYANSSPNEDIMGIGFNPHSGYVYIALENGISICSCMGHDIEFLVTDFNNGEEFFYESYNEAINHESILEIND